MLVTLILLVAVFVGVTLFGYGVHWAIHQPFMGRFNKSHMTHHEVLYPSGKFFSEKYLDAGKDNTTYTFLIAGAPIVLFPFLLWFLGVISLFSLVLIIAEIAVVGYLHDYLHAAFHVQGHWLHKVPGFDKLTKLHEVHHDDMSKNFGIYLFAWDKLFKTFKE